MKRGARFSDDDTPPRPTRQLRLDGGSAPAKQQRGEGGSAFVTCPLCSACVPAALGDLHASTCTGATDGSGAAAEQRSANVATSSCRPADLVPEPSSVEGQLVFLEFITLEEEASLLQMVDADDAENPWTSGVQGQHRSKRWGVLMDYVNETVRPAKHRLPDALTPIISRMRERIAVLRQANWIPNECNAIRYVRSRGDFLRPHVDHRRLSTQFIVNLCLAGDARMTYKLEKPQPGRVDSVDVHLPRRALQVQSGASRFDYKHSIANGGLAHEQRVSLNFRQSALTTGTQHHAGGGGRGS